MRYIYKKIVCHNDTNIELSLNEGVKEEGWRFVYAIDSLQNANEVYFIFEKQIP